MFIVSYGRYEYHIHSLCRTVVPTTLELASLSRDADNAHKFSLEDEHRVGRDGSHAPRAVSPIRLDGKSPLLAGAHVQQSLVPTLDDLALADVE